MKRKKDTTPPAPDVGAQTIQTCTGCGAQGTFNDYGTGRPMCFQCWIRSPEHKAGGVNPPSPSGRGAGGEGLDPNDWPAPTAPVSLPIPVELIDPNPEQPRVVFDEAELKALSKNIVKRGLIQPIVVHPNGERFTLHDGERRWRAHKLAGLVEIPAYIVPPGTDPKELLLRAIAANDQRADLTAIERAKSYQKLHDDYGLSDSDIASEVGKSRSVVANLRRLLQLPEDLQAQVSSGELSERQALALLPLYQLPAEVQQTLARTWEGEKLLKPKNLTSDQIRSHLRGALRGKGLALDHIDPDFVFSGDGFRHPTCTGCALYVKSGDDLLCMDRDCLKLKQNVAMTAYLKEAQAATGLAYLNPTTELGWRQSDQIGPEALQLALDKKCPNIRLQFRRNSYDYGAGPEAFAACRYQCYHKGAGCACAGNLRAEREAKEKEQKKAGQQLRSQVIQHVVTQIEGVPPQILTVLLYTMSNSWDASRSKVLEMKPDKVLKELARKIADSNNDFIDSRPIEKNREAVDKWLEKIGLPPLPPLNQVADLDFRLARIEGWLAGLPDPASAEHRDAIAGNLTNLAEIAEQIYKIDDYTSEEADLQALLKRLDAAKLTLLTRREQADQQAAYANDVASVKASLTQIADWLNQPAGHTNQKLLNRGQTASDLIYLVNTLIRQHGPQPELTALLTEIETAEALCMALRRKLSESAAPVEELEEIAA